MYQNNWEVGQEFSHSRILIRKHSFKLYCDLFIILNILRLPYLKNMNMMLKENALSLLLDDTSNK